MRSLAEANIGTGIHYPVPLHLQDAYASLGYGKGSLPIAEAAAGRILSISMHPHLQPDQLEQVAKALQASLSLAVAAHSGV
jgi:dTDP-4-amino-4,6-dideoxygalactose transaminase